MALLLLTFVRTDLLDRWQLSMSAENAPNRFIINVQEDQQADVQRVHGRAEARTAGRCTR